jgi:hypothetical protein
MKSRVIIGLVSIVAGLAGAVFVPSAASANCVTVEQIQVATAEGTYVTCGGDDISYRIPISDSVVFGGITYNDVYATTNSVITFGSPDETWSNYPPTPGISFQSLDWVEGVPGSPYWYNSHSDEFFNITTTNSGFVVELQGRYYWTYPNGELIHNILAFVRASDGTLNIQSFTSSSENQYRNGCRLTYNGPIIDFDTCGITPQVSLLAILELVDQIANNEVPVVEGDRRDPIQQSKTDSISGLLNGDQSLVSITVNGNFIENIVAIMLNGEKISYGSWNQNLTSVTFLAPKSMSGVYEVQIFNAAVPLVNSQSFTLIG